MIPLQQFAVYKDRVPNGSKFGTKFVGTKIEVCIVPQPVSTTGTYVVAWPQGDQLLRGGP